MSLLKTPTALKKVLHAIALLLLLGIVLPGHSQGRKVIYLQSYDKAPYHFGFLLGANFMGYSIKTIEDYQNFAYDGTYLPAPKPHDPNDPDEFFYNDTASYFYINKVESNRIFKNFGFSVGIIGDLTMGRYCNLRFSPTLSFGWRKVWYDVELHNADGSLIDHEGYPTSEDNLCTYAELPLHLKYRSKRYNNVGAYLFGGVNPKFYLFSMKKALTGTTTTTPMYLLPKRADVALEFGAGYDIYNQWFKMGIEIKASFGLLNLLREDAVYQEYLYQAPMERLNSRQLQLSLTFE